MLVCVYLCMCLCVGVCVGVWVCMHVLPAQEREARGRKTGGKVRGVSLLQEMLWERIY